MRLTILIPIMNGLRWLMPMWGCLKFNTSEETEWLLVDNGSDEPIEEWVRKYIKPKKLNFVRFEKNIGLMETNRYAYENCTTDLLMLLHTDCFIYEKDWDQRIISYFYEIDKLGIAGFFGAQGCLPDGSRHQDIEKDGQMSGLSNMLEAEIHGVRMRQPWRSCAIFDSFAMVLNMEMLKKDGGFDMRYKWLHYYDRDISLESIRRGYKNIVVDIPCHHIGGLTGESAGYQKWLKEMTGSGFEEGKIHNENKQKFINKWKDVLPLYVNDDFSFRSGQVERIWPIIEYKGDAILKMKLTPSL
ncbi:MAG: glycosyltransferase family 2 protein [Actinomycetota bacterium]